MILGAYEIKTARNNNVRNIFNPKYNQITVCYDMTQIYIFGYRLDLLGDPWTLVCT